jgi:hypothetical protein
MGRQLLIRTWPGPGAGVGSSATTGDAPNPVELVTANWLIRRTRLFGVGVSGGAATQHL